jgi:hypothetical protein
MSNAGQKIIEGLEEAIEHARGERPLRYGCGHYHWSVEEARHCPEWLRKLAAARQKPV